MIEGNDVESLRASEAGSRGARHPVPRARRRGPLALGGGAMSSAGGPARFTAAVGQAPAYFNTGCCAFPDGDITGLELVDGRIRLVRWPKRAPQCEELATAELAEIFQTLAADGDLRERGVDGASVR